MVTHTPKRACRIVVLDEPAGTEAAHRGGNTCVADTLGDVLRDAPLGIWIDVFVPNVDPSTLCAATRGRIRQHAACSAIDEVLKTLQPDALTDIAWVHAGWRVPPRWWLRLQEGLLLDDRLGTVSALDLSDEWLSPLPAELERSGPPDERRIRWLDQWLSLHADPNPLAMDAPGLGVGVIQGRAAAGVTRWLNSQTETMGPDTWQAAMAALGFSHGLSRCTLVHGLIGKGRAEHTRSGLLAGRELWRAAHPLMGLRHATAEVWSQPVPTAASDPAPVPGPASTLTLTSATSPVRLHVSHSWGGGLAKWVRDFNRTDAQNGTGSGLVLRSVGVFGAFGQRLTLHAGNDDGVPLRFWELGVPIHATAVSHPEVRAILREVVDDFGVEQVIVSSLIGHSLDVLNTGLPTVLVAHDHHPFCVALYASFDGECRSCDRQRLKDCLAHNAEHRFFPGVTAEDWMSLRSAFVKTATDLHLPIAAPSMSVAQRWRSLMPDLQAKQFRVIEHGLELGPAPAFDPSADGPLKVLILGRLTPEKGAALLVEMLPDLLNFCNVVLLGCGERLDTALRSALKHPRVQIVPDFDNSCLPTVLATLKPHLGLLMSTVPETFSYTLSEMWHCGIPVVATSHGALADRIEHGCTGYLEPANAQALLQRLRQIDADRTGLLNMRRHLLTRTTRTNAQMVHDYEHLLHRRGQTQPKPDNASASHIDLLSDNHRIQAHRHHRVLHVNPEATWRQTALAFWHFTCLKASRSPRVPLWIQRWFARCLRA